MTTPNDLTERYLEAAAAQAPGSQRDILRRELAERIADTVDAKTAAGATPAEAEHATLTELGDPVRLAADYVDRPLHLIGPRYYLLWRHLMRVVVPIVAVVGAVGAGIGAIADGQGPAGVLAETLGVGVEVALYVAAVITGVLAVMERRIPAEDLDVAAGWQPEKLLELTTPGARRTRRDQIWDAVWLMVLGVVVAFGNQFSFVRVDGQDVVRVLDVDTWAWLRWSLLAVIAVELVLILVSFAQGRWTWWHAGINAALDAVVLALLVPVLATGSLLDPAALVALGWADGPAQLGEGGTLATLGVVVVILVGAADAISGFVRAARAPRPARRRSTGDTPATAG